MNDNERNKNKEEQYYFKVIMTSFITRFWIKQVHYYQTAASVQKTKVLTANIVRISLSTLQAQLQQPPTQNPEDT